VQNALQYTRNVSMRLALADNGRVLFQRENLNRTLPSVRASEKTAERSGVLLEFLIVF
jgi:hypothetical protein